MTTVRRFVKDESGMTMALTVIMVVVIGVMGAGLLTFVSSDLNIVTEENRGQRAFEMADAGVAAARHQLLSDCGSNLDCQGHYNGSATPDLVDNQWSTTNGGVTLNNLDLDENGATLDCVNVKISATGTYDFDVISTGYYHSGTADSCEGAPVAKRKIEAKLHGELPDPGFFGGGPPLNPGYYTPSDILIAGNLSMAGESLFSEKNIVIKGLLTKTRQGFQDAASTNSSGTGDPLGGSNTADPLDDWYSPELSGNQNWNLVRRWKLGARPPLRVPSDTYNEMGFAAQGKICSPTSSSALTCTDSDPSVADGVFGYDSTTGKPQTGPNGDPTLYPNFLAYSNHKAFVPKDDACSTTACPTPTTTQDPNTISYPFPRVRPGGNRLFDLSDDPGNAYWACPAPAPSTCSPPFTTGATPLFSSSTNEKVVFVDAKGNDLTFSSTNSAGYKGILVVWCGNLRLDAKFTGIIITLNGDGTSFGDPPGTEPGTNCLDDGTKGRFTIAAGNQDFSGWMYSNGGTGTETLAGLPGVTLEDNTKISPLPSGSDDLASIAFGITPPPSPPEDFSVQGWRELYQD